MEPNPPAECHPSAPATTASPQGEPETDRPRPGEPPLGKSPAGDPAANDPAAGDPAANDPPANDPAADNPAAGDLVVRDLATRGPSNLPGSNHLLAASALLLCTVPLWTLVDVRVARWEIDHPAPTWLSKLLDLAAIYSNGYGLTIVLVASAFLLRSRAWMLLRIATLAAGGGAVATLAKMFLLRPRPSAVPLHLSIYDYAWIWKFDPTLQRFNDYDPAYRAFPSASLATATALTVGLWVIAPKFRRFAVALCVATMIQRFECGAHFISDLFGSAAVGLAWAYVCYNPKLMGSLFDRVEVDSPRRQVRDSTVSTGPEIELFDADRPIGPLGDGRRAA